MAISETIASCLLWPNASAWIKMPLGTEVGLGSGDIVLHGDPAHTAHKGGRAPQFSARFYCGQMAGWTKMPLGMEVFLGPGDFVFDGDPATPRKKGKRLDMHQDATWYGGRSQPRQLCGRWGPSRHLPKQGRSPQFSAHVYCGQTAAWIKMPFGTEVKLGSGDIVLDGVAAPPRRGTVFASCLL